MSASSSSSSNVGRRLPQSNAAAPIAAPSSSVLFVNYGDLAKFGVAAAGAEQPGNCYVTPTAVYLQPPNQPAQFIPPPTAENPSSFTPIRPVQQQRVLSPLAALRSSNAGCWANKLKTLAMKVCEYLKEQKTTTYNSVADYIMKQHLESIGEEMVDGSRASSSTSECKNIRRRVYDALNVLMAMNIISKERKEIHWIGLPNTSSHKLASLDAEIQTRRIRLAKKRRHLNELIVQRFGYQNLLAENVRQQVMEFDASSMIRLPFLLLHTDTKTIIDCHISDCKTEYLFAMNNQFELHDETDVLKRLGYTMGIERGDCSDKVTEIAVTSLPDEFEPFLRDICASGVEVNASALLISETSNLTDSSHQACALPQPSIAVVDVAQRGALLHSLENSLLHQPPAAGTITQSAALVAVKKELA